MADTASLWTAAGITAFGVTLGFVLNGVSGALKTQYERRGHWLALRADIIRCGSRAQGYLDGGVTVPAGRLPVKSYDVSFPALLRADLLSEADIEALSRFFDNADSHNRSLDWAQEVIGSDSDVQRESGRARLKAKKIATGQPQYSAALQAVEENIRKRTGHRLLFWKRRPFSR